MNAIPHEKTKAAADTGEVLVFPLSYAQERLWFLDQLMPGHPRFNLNFAMRLEYPINVGILERSLNEIVRRHEILRTTFRLYQDEPVQLVAPAKDRRLPVRDLTNLPANHRSDEAQRLAEEEARLPFNLNEGPLLRTSLLRLGPQEHIFLVTMHHIVSDGWSMGLFWHELSSIWTAYSQGRPSPLPDLPLQYGDFSVWQRKWMQGKELESHLGYWKSQLADLTPLELHPDRPRPAAQNFRGATIRSALPKGLVAGLTKISQHENATLFMVLLAAFQTMLYRYTGEDDIAVGSYIAGRNTPETEPLIGFFLNTLVLRVNTGGNPTFTEMLVRTRQTTLDAVAHGEVPFAKLVEVLQPNRLQNRSPFFTILFQMLNVPTLSRKNGERRSNLIQVQRGTSVFDISCMVEETADGLVIEFEYDADLFEPETIEGMAKHYLRLLHGIAEDPARPLFELPMIDAAERKRLVDEWNRTEHRLNENLNLLDLFQEQVARHPDGAAFRSSNKTLTFGELDRRSSQLAQLLRSSGAAPEIIVGICLERSFDFAVALLAVLKSGAAFLPLDPSYPRERLGRLLLDSKALLVLTSRRYKDLIPQGTARPLYMDEITAGPYRPDPGSSDHRPAPQDLAYVIYTSGSTGDPKGVAVDHLQILNRLMWMWDQYPFAKGEIGAQKTAVHFVDSIWEWLGPLLRGVTSEIIPNSAVQDPEALVAALAKARVTRLWLVPSLLRAMLDAVPDLGRRLPLLKFWVSSGEPLLPDLVTRFYHTMPSSVLYNLYGTSEVWDATWFDTRLFKAESGRVPIGTPIWNVQVYVLDQHRQPVPAGVPGELYVGGAGLARGYLNRPDLTQEKFVLNPFSRDPKARLYRTGDLAHWLPNGQLEHLGRIDQQVKIRGFRIEPGEIEARLLRHPAVKEAAVLAREDDPGDTRLVGYLVSRKGVLPPTAELRDFLAETLPDHMIPNVFIGVEAMPLTASGKTDRRRLPAPSAVEGNPTRNSAPPESEAEQIIAGIWREVLRIPSAGIHDNFFDLGGHSLLMIRVQAKLRNAFIKPISVTDLFRYPTVASLARFLAAGPSVTVRPSRKPARKSNRPRKPVSAALARLRK